jgi:NAD(P)-dependent dehydrogenase (short-subunit alcohol dehydrogenase family)
MGDTKYLYDLFNLKGQVAVITGGLGKLGTHFTESLVKANAKVVIFDISDHVSDKLKQIATEYPVLIEKVDITDEKEVKNVCRKVIKKWGVPTILINNAGWKASPNISSKASVPFERYPMDVWEEVFRVNTTSAAICTKIIGSHMISNKKRGVVINITSLYALVSPDQRIYEYKKKSGKGEFVKDASYSASKAALIALTRDLGTQWAPYGIRVVALAPGGVFSPSSDKAFVRSYCKRVPLGRMASLDDLSGAIIYLASDASSYVTGTTLIVDGGWTAW